MVTDGEGMPFPVIMGCLPLGCSGVVRLSTVLGRKLNTAEFGGSNHSHPEKRQDPESEQ
jgi:hypothetical protein